MLGYSFKQYRRKQIAELRPYIEGEDVSHVSISPEDRKAGSPKPGDMIARNPKNHADQWLVARDYFLDNFEALEAAEPATDVDAIRDKALEEAAEIASVLAGVGYAGLWAEEIMSALSKAGYRILPRSKWDAKDKEIAELRKAMELARAVLARSITAGYNVPGPTLADIENAFWTLDAALKSKGQ